MAGGPSGRGVRLVTAVTSAVRLAGLFIVALVFAVGLSGCDPFGFTSEPAAHSPGERLGRDIAAAVHTEGRGECSFYIHDLWSCRVESDPGSGWSGNLTLRLGSDGCWRARHTRFAKGKNRPYSRNSLSFGDFEAFGRTLTGCTDIDG